MNWKDKKLLIVSPRPDDEIIGCGGLILRAIKEGGKVHVLFGSVGKSRQLVTGSTDEDTRQKETKAVAAFAGYSYEFMFIGDEFMRMDAQPQKSLIDPIEDAIKAFEPDAVVLPYRGSYDQDHRALFTAGVTALRPTPRDLRHFVPLVLECEEPYAWSTGAPFEANYYVDVTDYFEKKLEALKLHATQLRKEPFARSLENLRRLAELHGRQVGGGCAEAYRVLRKFE